ncbi:flavodoxin domain-containing protein [Actinopolymorpha pittospori]|uniref:Menaquinone-dependent protoporphyrinogen oxidase n=1 Tax=Actinopolymorpha pittospori TaxID=648752 RepID=A0A927R9K3_9ACTN|nr:flavodoxin domain-containing protein [Actinopolymorpha pittospori]MBE1607922.1 menaquinone-dependent protoporphyrinogen oxidase [Actinopolymorpha pittospori]
MVVLMGYASRHGSTRAIADRIAASLDEYGNLVEVHAIADAPDPGGYDAVVLGSGIYGGAWSPDAVRFVRRHVDALTRRPVWLFSVGLGPAAADQGFRLAGLMERQGTKILGGFSGILRPREHRVFAGVIQAGHLSRTQRLAFRVVRGRYGDFRDGKELDAWADDIARELASD